MRVLRRVIRSVGIGKNPLWYLCSECFRRVYPLLAVILASSIIKWWVLASSFPTSIITVFSFLGVFLFRDAVPNDFDAFLALPACYFLEVFLRVGCDLAVICIEGHRVVGEEISEHACYQGRR